MRRERWDALPLAAKEMSRLFPSLWATKKAAERWTEKNPPEAYNSTCTSAIRCRDGGRTRFQPEPGFGKRAPIPCSSPRVSARASLSLLVNLANIVAYVVARIVLPYQ